LANNTSGSFNTAFGTNALFGNTTASNNTAVGYQAGYSNTTGTGNVYVGEQAGYSTTSSYNTLVGEAAGNTVTSGQKNTFVGNNSGGGMTTGSNNTIIGTFDGNYGGLDIRTSSNNIVLSDGSRNPRIVVNSSGRVIMGDTSTFLDTDQTLYVRGQQAANFQADVNTGGGCVLNVNRQGSDGDLIRFKHAGADEGKISVSGTTVSYQGGHLSRWSQLADGSKDTSLLKGTVLTNLDQMAVWSHDAVAATYYEEGDELPEGVSVGDEKTPAVDAHTEDNEQLNCMMVSSVEGDPNVAGVLVNWDADDDGFNDMNVAMTGDMIIRIAQGTTVQRGDLLMSAGDGTAKPQGDDIVRSKTIAKVTSTHVTCTYDDGSYCVPCVLMAC